MPKGPAVPDIENAATPFAGAAAFLCMPASQYATGPVVAIDGGFLAGGLTRSIPAIAAPAYALLYQRVLICRM